MKYNPFSMTTHLTKGEIETIQPALGTYRINEELFSREELLWFQKKGVRTTYKHGIRKVLLAAKGHFDEKWLSIVKPILENHHKKYGHVNIKTTVSGGHFLHNVRGREDWFIKYPDGYIVTPKLGSRFLMEKINEIERKIRSYGGWVDKLPWLLERAFIFARLTNQKGIRPHIVHWNKITKYLDWTKEKRIASMVSTWNIMSQTQKNGTFWGFKSAESLSTALESL